MAAAPPSAADAAAALLVAYGSKHGGPPSRDAAIVLPLAQAMSEGTLSAYFAGTNNFGAMHATQRFATVHASDPGYGMAAFLDHAAGGGAYIARVSIFPTLSNGARAFLDLVERMVDVPNVADATDYATELYAHGYFEGTATPATPSSGRLAALSSGSWLPGDQANIASYAAAITRNVPAATAALAAARAPTYAGHPSAISSGDLAPLADRLTPAPSYAPHTLEHAQALLGAAADSPPAGAISLADATGAPGGQGVWMFGAPGALPAPSSPASSPSPPATSPVAGALVATAIALALGLGARAWLGPTRRTRPA